MHHPPPPSNDPKVPIHIDNQISNEAFSELRHLRLKNIGKVIIGNLNINSIKNKFDQLKCIINDNIDILIVTETKLDGSFPTGQFKIDGFSEPFRLDRNAHGGGILIYVREDIPCKQLSLHTFPNDLEGIFVEVNLRKTKWLLFGTYHPPSQDDNYFFDCLTKALDLYIGKYDNFLLGGDFNAEDNEPILSSFLYKYDAKNLQKEKTCFKNVLNPSCIDLFITNKYRSFQNTLAVSTGLSDFHKMSITVLKTKFEKEKPREVYYRDYKRFNEVVFKNDLKTYLHMGISYEVFEDVFLEILEKHAPMKKKFVRNNEVPYMTKKLKKAIMKRSELETKYHKTKHSMDLKVYKKQKNYVSNLYKKERKMFYKNLDMKDFLDNKKFWQNVKPLFSDKSNKVHKITIVEGENIISDDKNVAESLNVFFKDAVSSLDIPSNSDLLVHNILDILDPIESIIVEFSTHPSVLKIKEMVKANKFNFRLVDLKCVENEVKHLNPKKATTFKNIPAKLIKQTNDISSPILLNLINFSIINNTFPDKLKLADISPVFKKEDKTNVKNYRPVSVLPAISKIFERVLQKQVLCHMEEFLSPNLCGYRKGFSTQHALISLIEKWRDALDKKGFAGALLMDLSKAFDTLNHKLLIAKLEAYGFENSALKLMSSYLKNRFQRTKVNTCFSSWTELLLGIPQGSVLGPLLFNIYFNDLFWFLEQTEACNYADDTSLYVCDKKILNVITRLEHDAAISINWFNWNFMKLNESKCHLIIAGPHHECLWIKMGEKKIWEKHREKLLGVTIDNNLNFNYHINQLCDKAGKKLSALIRLCRYYSQDQRRLCMKSFIESQFSYSPMVWMFHDRGMNNKINKLHERALRVVYQNDVSSFEELLEMDGSLTIHYRNIHKVAIEMYKSLNNLGPALLNDIFKQNNGVKRSVLRLKRDFVLPQANTVHFGQDSLQFFGSKIWDLIPMEIKSCKKLEHFKDGIKKWVPNNCPCRLCKTYIPGIGYL